MREKLIASAKQALASTDTADTTRKTPNFQRLFAAKIGSLFDSGEDGNAGKGTKYLHAYLRHLSKAAGISAYLNDDVTQPNEGLLNSFSQRVLQKVVERTQGADRAEISDEDMNALIDDAIEDEYLEMGAVDTLSHKVPDTTAEARNKHNIWENYILSGTGPDAVDNGLATPASRIGKLVYLTAGSSPSAAVANNISLAYNGIMYGFFGAMILYVLQLPALYLYRRFVKGDKNASVRKTEVTMGAICTTIAILTGVVVFVPAAVILLYPFVIALFTLALAANVIGLGLLLHDRHTAERDYNNSVANISQLRNEIKALKNQREACYRGEDATVALTDLNKQIAEKSSALKEAVAQHQVSKKLHEDVHSSRRLRYAIIGTVIAALVLAAFVISVFCPPTIALIAVGVSAVLGTIGMAMVFAKIKHKFNLDVKSRRENEIEVELGSEQELANDVQPSLKAATQPGQELNGAIDEENESATLLRNNQAAELDAAEKTPTKISREGLFGVHSRKSAIGHEIKAQRIEATSRLRLAS